MTYVTEGIPVIEHLDFQDLFRRSYDDVSAQLTVWETLHTLYLEHMSEDAQPVQDARRNLQLCHEVILAKLRAEVRNMKADTGTFQSRFGFSEVPPQYILWAGCIQRGQSHD